MQSHIDSIYKDFLKKCLKIADLTSQFEIISLLCKNSSLQSSQSPSESYSNILQNLTEPSPSSIEDLSVHVLKKTIQLLLCYYQAKSLVKSDSSDVNANDQIFQAVNQCVLNLIEIHSKQDKYALFFVRSNSKKFICPLKIHSIKEISKVIPKQNP